MSNEYDFPKEQVDPLDTDDDLFADRMNCCCCALYLVVAAFAVGLALRWLMLKVGGVW